MKHNTDNSKKLYGKYKLADIPGEQPRKIREYEILPIGNTGGYSEVRLARHPNIKEIIIVKYPKQDLSENYKPHEIDNIFMGEAILTWMLKHPNIPTGYGWFHDDSGKIHIAMERLSKGVEEFLMEQPTLERLYQVMKDTASAMSYVHSQDVVHCDISPKNIMVDDNKKSKLIDWGSFNRSGNEIKEILATPGFSPKSFTGEIRPSRDLYSFGLTITSLLLQMNNFPEQEAIALMRATNNRKTDAFDALLEKGVPTYITQNIIDNCLNSTHNENVFTAEDLEATIETFGHTRRFNTNRKSKNLITSETREKAPDY